MSDAVPDGTAETDAMKRHEKTNPTPRGRSGPAIASHGKPGTNHRDGVTEAFADHRQPPKLLSTGVDSAVVWGI